MTAAPDDSSASEPESPSDRAQSNEEGACSSTGQSSPGPAEGSGGGGREEPPSSGGGGDAGDDDDDDDDDGPRGGPGRGIGDILSDPELLDQWLHRPHPANRPYSASDAARIWDALVRTGYNPRLDQGHSRGVWTMPHINIPGTTVHIPVSPVFTPGL